MILTLNPNSALDYTLRIANFEIGATIRADACAWGMGGKANDAAWILGKLGESVTSLGFAAGDTGIRMQAMLQERGVKTDFVWTDGETRLNVVIVCTSGGQTTVTTPGLQILPNNIDELISKYRVCLETASCVVIGGSLPPGMTPDFYETVISMARQHNIPVIFDSSGLELLAGLKARPSLIKPNLDEFSYLLGYRPRTKAEITKGIKILSDTYNVNVVLTLGKDGAVASLEKTIYWIEPFSVQVESTAGAGDGVLAGLALAISRQETLVQGLIYGFALAGAIVQTLATADFRLEDYEKLVAQVSVVSQE